MFASKVLRIIIANSVFKPQDFAFFEPQDFAALWINLSYTSTIEERALRCAGDITT